ncbi:MAG: aspartate carbamoyltransferase catalytic subunit [Acidimicrobiales bacterium]
MRHFLDIADHDASELTSILDLAEQFSTVLDRDVPKVPALRGRTIVLAFFEDSTRTRTSFDLAARRLSADVVNFAAGSSSLKKGESLRDTIETIAAMGIDALVVRHASSGAASQIRQWTDASVINAGDGWHQHPTQAMLDAFTIRRRLGSIEGRHILICGDVQHSRVARSDVEAFTRLGAKVTLVAPRTLLPPTLEGWPVEVAPSLDDVIADVDVAYFLRIQKERMSEALLPSDREYRDRFGLTVERAKRLAPDAVIMHPGPMNRGVEIDPAVADDPRSAVLDQVANGVAVRMAVLYTVLGPGQFDQIDPGAAA